jgi:hypothetical protein
MILNKVINSNGGPVVNTLDSLSDCEIASKPLNKKQVYYFMAPLNKWVNQMVSHDQLMGKGSKTHIDIDNFINSKPTPSGLCGLDGNSKIPPGYIPTIIHY